jgi:hypothetical protein
VASESIESERCGVHEEIIIRERYAEIRERSVDTCRIVKDLLFTNSCYQRGKARVERT